MSILGLDTSLIAGIIGGVQGSLFAVVKNWQDSNLKYKLAREKLELNDINLARNNKNKPFLFTRRLLVIMIMLYLCGGTLYASITGVPIYVSYTETHGWVTSIFAGDASVRWVRVEGFPILPVICYGATMMWGTYFGGGGSKHG